MGVFEWPSVRRGDVRGRPGARRTATASRSSAAATRCAPCTTPASPTGSRGSRPAAAPRSSCSKARSCPAWRRSRRLMLIAGNWKMFKGPREAGEFCRALRDADAARGRRRRRLPAVRLARRRRAGARRHGDRRLRAELPLGARGRVHRRGLRADAARARRLRHDRRPLGAAPVLRRDRRDRRAALPRRAGERAARDRLRRRDPGRARGGRDRGGAAPPGRRARGRRQPRDRLRAGLGDRHREDRDARDGAARRTRRSSRCSTCRCSTAARSSRRTPPSCSRRAAVDGALVGGASLDVDSFAAICRAASRS